MNETETITFMVQCCDKGVWFNQIGYWREQDAIMSRDELKASRPDKEWRVVKLTARITEEVIR